MHDSYKLEPRMRIKWPFNNKNSQSTLFGYFNQIIESFTKNYFSQFSKNEHFQFTWICHSCLKHFTFNFETNFALMKNAKFGCWGTSLQIMLKDIKKMTIGARIVKRHFKLQCRAILTFLFKNFLVEIVSSTSIIKIPIVTCNSTKLPFGQKHWQKLQKLKQNTFKTYP